jgi:hypothetical protein
LAARARSPHEELVLLDPEPDPSLERGSRGGHKRSFVGDGGEATRVAATGLLVHPDPDLVHAGNGLPQWPGGASSSG